VRDLDHSTIAFNAVDGAVLQLARLGAQVARVGEVDASFQVNGQVIGGIEALAHVLVGNRLAFTGFHVPARDAAAAFVRSFTGNEKALRIEFKAIGLAAVVRKNGGLFALGIEANN
jgi:hypothetical protein